MKIPAGQFLRANNRRLAGTPFVRESDSRSEFRRKPNPMANLYGRLSLNRDGLAYYVHLSEQ
jgi:hypothetical protein